MSNQEENQEGKMSPNGIEQQSEDAENAKTKLIINYLPSNMTQEEMKSFFSSIGAVESCRLIKDKVSGLSLGYGFVNYLKPEDAANAIIRLNGLKLQNKTIKVAYSRPNSEIKGAVAKGDNIYISGIPPNLTVGSFLAYFNRFGLIVSHKLMPPTNPTDINQRAFGFIRYSSESEALKAIEEMNGQTLPGATSPIAVKFANRSKTSQSFQNTPSKILLTADRGLNRFSPFGNSHVANSTKINNSQGASSIFVYNLGPDAEENELWRLFGPFGAVLSVKIFKEKGYGFVNMVDPDEALHAIQSLNGYKHNERFLQVSFKSRKI